MIYFKLNQTILWNNICSIGEFPGMSNLENSSHTNWPSKESNKCPISPSDEMVAQTVTFSMVFIDDFKQHVNLLLYLLRDKHVQVKMCFFGELNVSDIDFIRSICYNISLEKALCTLMAPKLRDC